MRWPPPSMGGGGVDRDRRAAPEAPCGQPVAGCGSVGCFRAADAQARDVLSPAVRVPEGGHSHYAWERRGVCEWVLGQAVRAGGTAPKDHSLTCVCVCDVHSVRVCARDSAFFGGSLPALARAGPANALTSVEMTSHGYKKAKLNLPADQRKALFRSLTTEVIRHGRITTTQHRAKAIRGEVRPSFRCRCLRRGTEVGWARAPRPQWDSARTAVPRCGLGRAGLGREWCTLRAGAEWVCCRVMTALSSGLPRPCPCAPLCCSQTLPGC